MRLRVLPLAALLLGGLPACTGTLPPPAAVAVAENHVREELYFGMRKRDSTLVSEAAWQAFVDSVVTPRFPHGFTVLTGYGQYQADGEPLVREPTKVLILIHRGGPDAERRTREIAALYCRRFDQESVMRVRDRVEAEFLDFTRAGKPEVLVNDARVDSTFVSATGLKFELGTLPPAGAVLKVRERNPDGAEAALDHTVPPPAAG
jgi:hypothetical protein